MYKITLVSGRTYHFATGSLTNSSHRSLNNFGYCKIDTKIEIHNNPNNFTTSSRLAWNDQANYVASLMLPNRVEWAYVRYFSQVNQEVYVRVINKSSNSGSFELNYWWTAGGKSSDNVNYKENEGVDIETENTVINSTTYDLYPQPAEDKITVDNGNIIMNRIKIYSLSGDLIAVYDVDVSYITLDVSNLVSGTYFIDVDGVRSVFIVK